MQARCLIVEDDPLQAEGLKSLVELHGHRICGIASRGEDAVSLARDARPDIAFIDIGLEGSVDGIEAAERIRQTSPCRMVFITGQCDSRALARIRPLGIVIVHKPVNPALIAAVLHRSSHGLH